MSLVENPPPVLLDAKPPRIKRKPPPALDISERYPSPDPSDPFAPLWVLRNRTSSALLGLPPSQESLHVPTRRSLNLYPTKFIVDHYASDVEYASPLKSPLRRRENHYRRRSQSIAVIPSPPVVPLALASPSLQFPLLTDGDERSRFTATPSLVRDSSNSDTSTDDGAPIPRPPSRNKLARLLLPKKTSLSGITHASRPTATRRVSKLSISPPVTVHPPIRAASPKYPPITGMRPPNTPSHVSLASVDSPHYTSTFTRAFIQRESDAGYHSQPETLPSHPSPLANSIATDKRRLSSLPVDVSLYAQAPSVQSHSSSSYINVSTPSYAPSPRSSTENAFTSSRPAPHRSPFLRGPRPHKLSRPHPHTALIPPPLPEWVLPTPLQLLHAASLPVIAESGLRVTFGSIFESKRTIVIFIRHFWCPLCQDYMSSLTSLVRPEMLRDTADGQAVQLVIVSNGAPALIGKYKQIFDMPYTVYTDPSLDIYVALGMGRNGATGSDLGPVSGHMGELGNGEKAAVNEVAKSGGYVKHGLVGGIAMVVVRALKVGWPVWEKGGDIGQLGGEFVFGPGLTCTYAHRMQSTKDHAPILDILRGAGVRVSPSLADTLSLVSSTASDCTLSACRAGGPAPSPPVPHNLKRHGRKSVAAAAAQKGVRASVSWAGELDAAEWRPFSMTAEEETQWMEKRVVSLERLNERKSARRGGLRVEGAAGRGRGGRVGSPHRDGRDRGAGLRAGYDVLSLSTSSSSAGGSGVLDGPDSIDGDYARAYAGTESTVGY